ncbi:hypothetical protein D3X11_00680 [Streptococcus sp. X16XC17]|uniref:hypothetical protein n=1 Tax=unclassified Streptococcus TaxID=2608887 RepID=UPI00066FEBBB|nr:MULTISPECIES: hypothetical protein [unclassified Streptococcus]TCD46030.1 hypothetical protein D3X11_00680 [Streptococcus sp. X16XC17]
MKPNDTFSYLAGRSFVADQMSLLKCYQPILGLEAYALYQYLTAFYDNGVGRYKFAQILNHLNLGTQVIEQSLDILMAMDLVDIYQEDNNVLLDIKPPLPQTGFLNSPRYKVLLSKKIGESAVETMTAKMPLEDKKISKQFSDVFTIEGQLAKPQIKLAGFDIVAFERMMSRDQLRFHEQETDVLGLYHLAEQEGWNWVDAYQLAKETAVERVISIKRMTQQVQQKKQTKSFGAHHFTSQEEALIRESKGRTALQFLGLLKASKKATMTSSERNCLQEMAGLGLLDEVINVIVLYSFNRVDSANLNEKYVLKVANDFSYRGIVSAEMAVEALHETKQRKSAASSAMKQEKTNVPEWSKKEVQQESTAEGKARMEALRQQMMAAEGKERDGQ